MFHDQPINDFMPILDAILLSRNVSRMEVPQNAGTDRKDNENDYESLT
jgi:hypothetical protein